MLARVAQRLSAAPASIRSVSSTITLIAPAQGRPQNPGWVRWQDAGPRYVRLKALADEHPYWWPHIHAELFGTAPRATRMVRHTNDRLLHEALGRTTEIHVDLLEHVSIALSSRLQVGVALIHLRVDCPSERLIGLIDALRKPLVRDARFTMLANGSITPLEPSRPGLAAVGRLVDSVSARSWLYSVSAALPPNGVDLQVWARALARARSPRNAATAIERDVDKARRLELPLGPHLITVLGRGAGIALHNSSFVEREATLRYARSYWSEAIAFGVLQLLALQRLAERMGALPADPASTRDLDDVHEDWLAFRQRLWWSSLSADTAVPGEILNRFHDESPSRQLLADISSDMDTFVTRRSVGRVDAQERALARLQIGGAGLASAGVIAAALAVALQDVDLCLAWRIAIPVLVLLFAAAVSAIAAKALPS
ncbi:MAG TPA: hypothetical protein VGO80_18665 [Solirubrobacteraceae bacterium]|nr:hypothetical protein [Solirubrobacteraceae bacterium]